VVNIGLLILLGFPFDQSVDSVWLPLAALPYFLLYARDLRYNGYPIGDVVRIYALNLLLIPVHLGGVFKSLQQAITGQRIPFCRTPKVSGRTAAPAGYVLAEYSLLLGGLVGFCIDLAAERWVSAAFCIANTVMLGYAIASFIGFRQSLEDIGLARRARLPAEVPALGDAARTAGISARGASQLFLFSQVGTSQARAWQSANQSRSSVHARTSRNPARRSSALKSSSAYL
jgi:hypothetical protein